MFRFASLACTFVLLPGLLACSAGADPGSTTRSRGSGGSTGSGSTGSGGPGPTGGGPIINTGGNGTGNGDGCAAELPVMYRDFKGSAETGGHPDFEASARGIYNADGSLFKGWNDGGCGLVEPAIGAGSKPVFYAGPADVAMGGPMVRTGIGRQQRTVEGPGCFPATSGICRIGTCAPWKTDMPTYVIQSAMTFANWFNPAPGFNMEIPSALVLMETAPGSGIYVYDTNAFFPLDGQGFGNTPGQQHNYHFTTEIHVKFEYQAGQIFTFRGDDDLWIFVNGKLALDVGGMHQALEGSVNFDAQAAALGITAGQTYQMDIFHAERQTSESNFRIETNIRCFTPVTVF